MSLRDDMEALAAHIDGGTGEEFMQGTAPEIDIERSGHDGKIARDQALRFGKVTEVSGYGY